MALREVVVGEGEVFDQGLSFIGAVIVVRILEGKILNVACVGEKIGVGLER